MARWWGIFFGVIYVIPSGIMLYCLFSDPWASIVTPAGEVIPMFKLHPLEILLYAHLAGMLAATFVALIVLSVYSVYWWAEMEKSWSQSR
jgi:hypothetical protein